MRRTSKLLIVIGFVFIVVGMILYFSPIRLPETEVYDLGPGGHLGTGSYWGKGEIVVNFTVSGGDEQIDFHIEDPYRTIIYNETEKNRLDFTFTTEIEGSYSLNFHNPQQSESIKTITLTQQRIVTRGPDLSMVIVGVIILIMVWVDFFKIVFPERRREDVDT